MKRKTKPKDDEQLALGENVTLKQEDEFACELMNDECIKDCEFGKDGAKNRVGRPSRYSKKLDQQVYQLCLLGAVDSELAEFFEICDRTLNYWKKEHPSFYSSMQNGKAIADANVVERLYKRAIGYSYVETTDDLVPQNANDAKSEFQIKYRKQVKKEMPPDTGACMAWLKNRRPDKWRETKAVDINVNPKLEDFLEKDD